MILQDFTVCMRHQCSLFDIDGMLNLVLQKEKNQGPYKLLKKNKKKTGR